MKRKPTLLVIAILTSISCSATNYFWVGGSGNWSDFNNHWATTSGGTTFHNQWPQSTDNVFFDGSSFSTSGQSVTIDQTIVQCADMTWIGVFNTPTLLGSSFDTLRIFGSLALGAGMNFNLNGQVSMEAITGKTITTSGTIINASVTFNGIGGSWTLQDALRVTNVIYLNNGTLNTNNKNVNSSAFYSNTVSTRSLYMGSSIFNLSNFNGVLWTINPTGMTLDAGTSTINGIGNGGSFIGGGFTYNDLFFTGIAVGNIYDNNTFHDVSFASEGVIFGSNTFHDVSFAGNATIYGNPMFGPNTFNNVTIAKNGTFWSGNIFNNLSFSPGYTYTLQAGQTQMVGNICAQGTGALPIRIQSGTAGVPAIISKASGTICWDYVHISDITAMGGATFNAGLVPTRSQNLGGNTGLLFTGGCTAVSCLPCATPSITTNPISVSVCAGTIANFSIIASGVNLTYQWQVNQGAGFINLSGIGSNLLGVQFVSMVMNGFQYRCLVSSGSCTSISNAATLTVNPAPIVTVNSPIICSGQTATLTASGATSYFWPSGALPPVPPLPPAPPLPPPPISGLTTNPIFVSPLITTTYTVTGTTNGCSNTAIATVTVYPMPTISAGQDATVASNTPVQLGSAFIPAFSYSWSPTTGLSNANVSNPTLILQNSGSTPQTYTYILNATNGICSKTDTVIVTVSPSQTPPINQMPDLDEEMAKPNANFYDIQSRVRAYFLANPDSTEVDGLRAKFNRWEWFWQGRVDDPITKSKSGGFNMADRELVALIQNPVCNTPGGITSNWTGLGPFTQPNPVTDQNMGVIHSLYIDPLNNNNIFAGSFTSGLFKTTNGGATWNNPDVSRLPAMGIRSIAVDPTSSNQIIYVATGMEAMGRPGYGIGVLKSTDGGAHWNQTALTLSPTGSVFPNFNVYRILMHPNNPNIIYAITDKKVYMTTDGFATVAELTTIPLGSNNRHFRDIQFRPGSSNTIFISGTDEILQSTNAGLFSWTNVTSNLTSTANLSRLTISATADAVYVFYLSGLQPRIDKYSFSSGVWSNVSTPFCTSNCWYDGGMNHNSVFVVSPIDPQVMYIGQGQNILQKSTDGGNTFHGITNYNTPFNGTYTHSDIRAVQLMQASAGGTADKLYVGNDGGILKTVNGGTSWTNINGTGLNITQFYGLGGTESNANLLVGGTQDNGLYTYNAPNWSVQVVGDAYDACIDKINPNIMFGAGNAGPNNNFLSKSTNTGGSWSSIAQPPPPSLTNRPLLIDNNNNWYAGYHDVFKSTSQGGSWTIPGSGGSKISNFTTDFNTTATLPGGIVYNSVPSSKPLVAIAVAPSDAAVIYAAYPGATWGTDPATGQSCGDCPQALAKTIFRTSNGGTSWTDITAGLEAVRYAGITHITVDPNNPYRVWVSFNDIWSSSPGVGINRVFYGRDVNGVWTWSDYSNGLPPFPVLSIVYQNGSDDALYAGTDVGVYYTNNTIYPQQGWVCYSANLPVVIVTDLEINYCAGKIRAATHGRGLWESPLVPSPPKILSSGTIAAPVSFTSDVLIPSGVTVTVTSTIKMAAEKKVIVERGGNLILNGGTITNDCGLMWHGIELQGNRNASQLTAGAQGKVILKNGALIESAREGISTIKTDANGNMDWNYTGGIIQANSSTFRNCRRDVQYLSYRNFNPVTLATMNNLGSFSNCIFETTQQLNDPNANLETRVTLYDVKGVRFLGNDFRNTAPPNANQGVIGSGIGSLDANYRVANLCLSTLFPCTSFKKNTFTNLDYGIYASNSNPLINVAIDGAVFINNKYDGVHLKGMNYPSVNNCSFNVGNNNSQLSAGLYLDNCKYYSVQNNQFSTTYSSSAVGIWVNDSKEGAHEIYNNKFTGLYAGIVPLNNNSGMTNIYDGLTMHCNEFIGNSYDIGVTGSGQNNSIAPVQGANNPFSSLDLVRNRYSASCGSENQFFINGSTKTVIHASHSDANTQPLPQPSCSDILVHVIPTNFVWQQSDCPNKLLLNKAQLSAKILALKNTTLVLKNNYTGLVDGGNTQQLLTAVNSTMPAGNLKNTLISKSPYLSDPVLVSYLAKPAIPPPGHIKDVVIANSPVTAAVKLKVDALNLPNGIKQQISNAQIGTSARLTLETQIIQTEFESQLYTADKINYFLNDTIETNPIDSVIKMLKIEPRPYASKELIQAYIAKGDYVNAQSVIDSLESINPLNDFCELQKLIIQINLAPEKAYSMQTNASLKSSVEAFANDCSKEGCAYAQALLKQVFNNQYPELRILPQSLRSMDATIANEEQAIETKNGLIIYPNPAKDAINIVFNDEDAVNAIVEIRDVLGKLIERMPLKVGVPYNYTTQSLEPAIYFISLYVDGKLVEKKKLVLIK